MADPGSISSGKSLPQWMKTKASDANMARDFDAQFASPPAHDDSFFLIKYPGITQSINKNSESPAPTVIVGQNSDASRKEAQDWSRHTQPCQQFISGLPLGALSKCPPTIKPKPAGTDDGFKGEGAACGSSILKVAQQMISGRSNSRAKSVQPSIHEDSVLQVTQGKDTMRNEPEIPSSAYLNMRRGSKSLPATPLSSPPGSPNSRRKNKNTVNRFFTGPFELPADISGSRSWILAGLLGQQREDFSSTSMLNEHSQGGSLAASVENLGASSGADAAKLSQQFTNNPEAQNKPQVYRPKPSELREMNFWSPTSM